MIGILRTTVLVGAAALLVAAALPHLFNKPMLANNTPEQNKVQYELQERCGTDAANFLERVKAGKVVGGLLGADDDEKRDVAENSNHYSARFNKCFISMDDTLTNKTNGADDEERVSVCDVNDTNEIAGFIAMSHNGNWKVAECWALFPQRSNLTNQLDPKLVPCTEKLTDETVPNPSSWDKWLAVIKPYMEDSD